jgi:hypothetical protein
MKAMYFPTIIGSQAPPKTFASIVATERLTVSMTPGSIMAASGAASTRENTKRRR